MVTHNMVTVTVAVTVAGIKADYHVITYFRPMSHWDGGSSQGHGTTSVTHMHTWTTAFSAMYIVRFFAPYIKNLTMLTYIRTAKNNMGMTTACILRLKGAKARKRTETPQND